MAYKDKEKEKARRRWRYHKKMNAMTKEEKKLFYKKQSQRVKKNEITSYNNKMFSRLYAQKIRKEALEALGGKCVRCGFNDRRALQIDHIGGHGAKDIQGNGGYNSIYLRKVIKSFLVGEGIYQLLCANCNWIKRSENNETREKIFTRQFSSLDSTRKNYEHLKRTSGI